MIEKLREFVINKSYYNVYCKLIEKYRNATYDDNEYLESHHIIPKHLNGSDDMDNLINLTFRNHILAHLLLWKALGITGDYVAYKFMRGVLNSGQMRKELASLGGKVQGQRNAESGHMSRIGSSWSFEDRSLMGKKAAAICKEKGVNAFFDPKLRTKICSEGGKVQGKVNASKEGYMSMIAKLPRVSNGQIGKKWITNGITNKRISPNEEFVMPDGFYYGAVFKCK